MKLGSSSRAPRQVTEPGPKRLNLTLAISEYSHVRDLVNGAVQPEGISLTPMTLPIEEIHYRFLRNLEFDVAEISFAKYVSLTAAGESEIVAIPVFPARVFRHSAIYVRKASGISTPSDLEGRTVGIPEWAQTAGVYLRGLLSEYYGVRLDRVRWVQAGVNQPGRTEKVRLALPADYHYESHPKHCLSDMLLAGDIDAALTARPPDSFQRGHPEVLRLFPEFRAEEQAYHEATGIFPIMHVMGIRRAVLEAHPWVAMNLFTAFEAAKDAEVRRLREITTSLTPLPWAAALAEEMTERMGGQLWPYGVDPNRHTLDAFCRFAHDQFLTTARLAAEDLFPAQVLSSYRV
jgi:4,5-dihydroxyphthalate decarboxylase